MGVCVKAGREGKRGLLLPVAQEEKEKEEEGVPSRVSVGDTETDRERVPLALGLGERVSGDGVGVVEVMEDTLGEAEEEVQALVVCVALERREEEGQALPALLRV